MLDAADAELDAAADRARRMAVRGGIAAPFDAFAHDRAHFVFAILVHPDRVGGGGDAARSHDLDRMRAAPELFAHGGQAGIDPVGDDGQAVRLAALAETVAMAMPLDAHQSHVAVPAGHRHDAPGIEEARCADQPFLDRAPQRPVATADVAHRREAAVERVAEHAYRMRGAVRGAHRVDTLEIHVGGIGVDVQVDQPRHQRPSAEVDAPRFGSGDRLVRHLLDCAFLDCDRHTVRAIGAGPVEEAGVFKDGDRHEGVLLQFC